jgi:hypothetical protein
MYLCRKPPFVNVPYPSDALVFGICKSMKELAYKIAAFSALIATAPIASANVIPWSGLDAAANVNTTWSDINNWTGKTIPGPTDTAYFDNAGLSSSQGPDFAGNIVDADITVASLWYAPTNTSPMWQNTVINSGVTLTVASTNIEIVLDSGTQTDPAIGTTQSYSTISGAGTLVLNDTNKESVVIVSQGSSTYANVPGLWASLDMSNLDNFIGVFGRLLIGVEGAGPTSGEVTLNNSGRQAGIMSLAATNSIHLTQTGNIQGTTNAAAAGPALVINDTPFFGDSRSALTLGQSNALWADSITVGRQQCNRSAFLEFNASFTPSQLYLRGQSTNRVAEFVIGDNTANGANGNVSPNTPTQGFGPQPGDQDFIVVPNGGIQVGSAGVVDLSGGSSDIMIDTLIIGKGFKGSGGGYAAGIFNLGDGILNVNSLQIGAISATTANFPAFGVLNVDGGTVIVNGTLALGQGFGGAATQLGYGTLNINGGAVLANSLTDSESSSNSISINGGSLLVSNAIGTTRTLANLSLNSSIAQSSLTLNINSGPLNVITLTSDGGSVSNAISISALPQVFLLPAAFPVIQASSAINLNGGAFNYVLGTLPKGYAGYLINGGNAVEVVLTSAPASANVWSAGDPNDRTNWSDALNWNGGVPTSSSAAAFSATASKSAYALAKIGGGVASLIPANINNVVDTSFTISGLIYTNLNGYENTYIPGTNTLTVSALASIGISSADLGDNATVNVTISGSGAFDVDDAFFVGLGDTNSGNASEATLDMSALNTFNANVNTFLVGVGGYASGYNVPQNAGVVYLAQTNIITATSATTDGADSTPVAFEIGDADSFVNGILSSLTLQGSVGSALYLGENTIVSANYISVGRQLATGGIWFNPSVTNANPTTNSGPVAWFQGIAGAGSSVNNWTIGDGVANPLSAGVGGSGTNDFTGGWVNAKVSTLTVANSSSNSQTAGPVNGSLTLAAGVINAGTLNVSYNNAFLDGNVYSYGIGTVNVKGIGSLNVSGAINLAWTGGPLGGGATPTAALNINGLDASVNANSVVGGANGGISIVSISGGSLTVSNGLGTASAPVTTLNLTNATIAEGALTAPFLNAQNVNVGGTTTTFNVLALPAIEISYPVTLTLVQSATTIQGSASYNVILPTNFTGSASLGADSKSIVLTLTSGPVVTRGRVFWKGLDNGNMNWSDAANWFLPPVPAPVDTAFFDNIGVSSTPGAGAADNIVDSSITVGGLWYAQTNSNGNYGWHNTVINSGVTLTVANTNASIILDTGTQTDPHLTVGPGSATCYSTISGEGTLSVDNTNANSFFVVSQGSSTYAATLASDNLFASMDISGLNTFNGTFGRLLLGVEGAAASPGVPTLVNSSRQTGRLALAATNVIHLTHTGNVQGASAAALNGAALVICDQGGTSGGYGDFASYLFLGQSNAFFADTITVGREATVHTAVLEFNPTPPWTGPQQFFLRGESSNRVSEVIVADNTLNGTFGNTATTGGLPSPGIDGPIAYPVLPPPGGNSADDPTGANVGSAALFDVSAGTSDMMIDTLIIGKGYNNSGGGYADGVFNLGPGTLDVNNLTLAKMSSSASHVPCVGLLNVMDPAGVVIVNNRLALGQPSSGLTSQYTFAAITNSGTLEAASITSGGNSSIALTTTGATNATLSLTSAAGSIGTVAAPIGSITLSGGTILDLAVGGTAPTVVTSNLTASGTTDTINVTSLPSFAMVPGTNVLIQSLTPISGNDFVLGSLPNGYNAQLQTSADNTSILLIVTTAAPPMATPPTLTQANIVSGDLVLSGINGTPNGTYYLLGSTNLALPPGIRWSIVSTNAFNANGNFNLSLPVSKATGAEFYAIKPQ